MYDSREAYLLVRVPCDADMVGGVTCVLTSSGVISGISPVAARGGTFTLYVRSAAGQDVREAVKLIHHLPFAGVDWQPLL